MATRLVCTPRTLSPGQRATAASLAASMGLGSPTVDNTLSPAQRLIEAARRGATGASPAVIAVVKSNYWGKHGKRLTTGFMDNPSKELRREILRHLNMWSSRANVQFVESNVDPLVRIDRRTGATWGGYWSYVGTEILGIPKDQPTMNFEGFTMSKPASEFKRVVCHEAGHTLGFPHEHMRKAFVERIDPDKAYAYFLRTEGWSRQDVDEQVLSPLSERSLIDTPPDQTSIMCYQLPASIMRDNKPILGGNRINATDYKFAATIYPLPAKPAAVAGTKRGSKPKKARRATAAGRKPNERKKPVAKRKGAKRTAARRRA
jgi:hypothetical protein